MDKMRNTEYIEKKNNINSNLTTNIRHGMNDCKFRYIFQVAIFN